MKICSNAFVPKTLLVMNTFYSAFHFINNIYPVIIANGLAGPDVKQFRRIPNTASEYMNKYGLSNMVLKMNIQER